MIKIIFLSLISLNVFASSSDELLSTFGGQCFTKGALRDQALSQSQNLSAIIKDIRDDDKCKSVTLAYDQFSEKLGSFNGFTRAAKISELEGNIQDLNSALIEEQQKGTTADQTYVTDLRENLNSLRLELFTARQSQDISQRSVQIEALRGVHDYSEKLISAVSAAHSCVDGHPNLGLQIGTQLLGVAGQYTSGLVSGGLIAGASIVSNLVGFFRDLKYNRELKNLDSARKAEAVGCALEAVSRTMCQARDYITLMNAKTEGGTCVVCQNYEEGLQILKQQLQSYSSWVQRVSAGTPAQTAGQASDKNRAYKLQNQFDSFVVSIDAALAEGKRDLTDSANPTLEMDAVFANIRSLLEGVSGTNTNCSPTCITEKGVLSKIFAKDPNCGPAAFLKSNGKDFECKLQPSETTCNMCLDRVYKDFVPTIDQLASSVGTLKGLAQQGLQSEKQKFVETDPLLALAKVDTVQTNNFRARDFLINTKAYFEKRLKDTDSVLTKSNVLKQAVMDAKTRIEKALEIFDKRASNYGDADVIAVSSELIPANNIFFISDKLNELVQQEYALALKSNKTPEGSKALAEYSVQESIAALLSQYGNKIAASAQAETAITQSAQTLSSLENIFGKDMLEEIPASQSKGSVLFSVQCFRALMLPSFKDKEIKKRCMNAELKADYKGKTFVLKFKDLVDQPLQKRACGIYDFSRREQILSRSAK